MGLFLSYCVYFVASSVCCHKTIHIVSFSVLGNPFYDSLSLTQTHTPNEIHNEIYCCNKNLWWILYTEQLLLFIDRNFEVICRQWHAVWCMPNTTTNKCNKNRTAYQIFVGTTSESSKKMHESEQIPQSTHNFLPYNVIYFIYMWTRSVKCQWNIPVTWISVEYSRITEGMWCIIKPSTMRQIAPPENSLCKEYLLDDYINDNF